MSPSITPDTSVFNKERHIKYWLRCLKTFLPTAYTSSDSNRVSLAYFTLSALDLLGALHSHTTPLERAQYVVWLYRCQHPRGGFRGFTGTDLGTLRDAGNAHWDPANLPATFFALASLLVLGDGLERVRRIECLEWLARLQREDGSFGEVLGEEGRIEGGADMRFCNTAAGVRWMLRGGAPGGVEDIDVERLLRYIRSTQTYDGGIGEGPFHEAQAGYTYCAISALFFLDRLPPSKNHEDSRLVDSDLRLEDTVRWLVYRQTTIQDDDEYSVSNNDSPTDARLPEVLHSHNGAVIPMAVAHAPLLPLHFSDEELKRAGMNGRCNKPADTCYSFWAGGALAILKKIHLIDFNANRRYLLEKTQHIIGGFGKVPGDPPDLLHSYMGLAALACMREPGLKSIDPALCASVSVREHLESLAWRQGGETSSKSSNAATSDIAMI